MRPYYTSSFRQVVPPNSCPFLQAQLSKTDHMVPGYDTYEETLKDELPPVLRANLVTQ